MDWLKGELMKKWLIGVISAVVIIPAIAFQWKHLQEVNAAPDEIASLKKVSAEQTATDKQLAEITAKQQTQIEIQALELKHTKEVNDLQIESLKEILKEIKKKK